MELAKRHLNRVSTRILKGRVGGAERLARAGAGIERPAQGKPAERGDDEEDEEGDEAVDQAKPDHTDAHDQAAPEDHLARGDSDKQEANEGADEACFDVAQGEGNAADGAAPAEVALHGEDECAEALEVSGGHERVGRDAGRDDAPAVEESWPFAAGRLPVEGVYQGGSGW